MAGTRIIVQALVCICFLLGSTSKDIQPQGRSFLDFFNIIRINPSSRFLIGVQITVPISVFMPDLGLFGRQSRSSFFQGQYPWTAKIVKPSLETCPSQGVSVEDYLHLLQIDIETCQKLFVCEMASNPHKFMPLSEILLTKLAFNGKWMTKSRFSEMHNSTEYYLYNAAKFGASGNSECRLKYWDCPVEASSMVNMNLLLGWQLLSKVLNIRFMGETEANLIGDSTFKFI